MSDNQVPLDASPRPPKVDPESLVLRGRPRRVVRFRRGVIVGAVAAVSASLAGLTWLALEPASFRSIAADNSGTPYERSSPEPLAGAPRDYRDVPVLGPPLPGDLGRPIVEQQRKFGTTASAPQDVQPDRAVQRLEAEQQQLRAAEQAARSSSVVVQLADQTSQAPSTRALAAAVQSEPPPAASHAKPKLEFGDWSESDGKPNPLMPPASRYVVGAGTVIPASLLTGLNSDLPGMVLAQVTQNVRDSVTGREILIPQGARLLGRYDSGLSYGQKRAFVVWQRILFPDGSSVRLDNMPASDAAGYGGLSDRVDGHGWELIKGIILSSLLGVGTQLSLGSEHGIIRALRESAQQNGSQAGEQVVSKGLTVQPTIKVRPGWPVRVLVSEDLVLQPWKG